MSSNIEHFTRANLTDFGDDDGHRQALAWDRLRRVCAELGLRVPSLAEVRVAGADLREMQHAQIGRDEQEWAKGLFGEEWKRLVICSRASDGEPVVCQFDGGYILFQADEKPEPAAER